ncbi:MAG: hypothetical protein M1834_000640 [Cirrosporium novae-zelandiae]|nr:MAG: hypothetical protein M1834_000640 [Cirrosporium novae-zelandiae]
MSLPPEVIHIKRRRDEEPPDTLYIQSENDQEIKRRRFTDYGFSRLQDVNTLTGYTSSLTNQKPSQKAVSSLMPNEVPQLKIGDNLREERGDQNERSINDVKKNSARPHSSLGSVRDLQLPEIAKHVAQARRFHLTHARRPSSPISFSQPSFSGVRKRKKGQKQEPAVFIERSPEAKRKSGKGTLSYGLERKRLSLENEVKKQTATASTPRKRPIASATEKMWRAEQWSQNHPSRSHPSIDAENNDRTLQLAQELQEFALQETRASMSTETSPKSPGQISKLKFQPKQPQHRRNSPSSSVLTQNQDSHEFSPVDDDGDYVFDTYIRQPVATLASPLPVTGLEQSVISNNIGFLVITEEDEEFLDTFEDEEGDGIWDSEDEDSNAEDHPFNDYPEDEVNSDDEYGYGAYQYRHAASDDEQFDEDDIYWSDDENQKHPWKSNILQYLRLDVLHQTQNWKNNNQFSKPKSITRPASAFLTYRPPIALGNAKASLPDTSMSLRSRICQSIDPPVIQGGIVEECKSSLPPD